MPNKRMPYLLAAAALAAGAGVGAGSYAAFGSNGSNTTTVIQGSAATGSPTAATKTLSVNGVYRAARDAVVEITTTATSGSSDTSPFPFGGSQKTQAQGSGFVFDSNGHIITNDHVVAGASSISVMFADGSKYSAKVVGANQSSDLAVLKVEAPASKLHPPRLGDSSTPKVGGGVVASCGPFALGETVKAGIVSSLDAPTSSTDKCTVS